MRKNRGLLGIVLLGLCCLIVMVAGAVFLSRRSAASFRADGYVMAVDSREEELTAVMQQFAAGSPYRDYGLGTVSLRDLEGDHISTKRESFIHHSDESLSAFSDGVIVNMDDVNGGIMNYYSVEAGTV